MDRLEVAPVVCESVGYPGIFPADKNVFLVGWSQVEFDYFRVQ